MKKKIQQLLNTLFGKFLFDEQELLLSFEYGLVLAKSAQDMKVDITSEISEKAEIMILGEFKSKGPQDLANEMAPNILSVFELDLSK